MILPKISSFMEVLDIQMKTSLLALTRKLMDYSATLKPVTAATFLRQVSSLVTSHYPDSMVETDSEYFQPWRLSFAEATDNNGPHEKREKPCYMTNHYKDWTLAWESYSETSRSCPNWQNRTCSGRQQNSEGNAMCYFAQNKASGNETGCFSKQQGPVTKRVIKIRFLL